MRNRTATALRADRRSGRFTRSIWGAIVSLLVALLGVSSTFAANYRTANFMVTAPNKSLAREIGDAAEGYRERLATEWLGRTLPRWGDPCPILVEVGDMGAGGATSFKFRQGVPYSWRMSISGSRERILDSVLPHEVTHTIFATHFGRPLPRWADEGACTTVEHPSERARQEDLLIQFLRCDPPRSIAFNDMVRIMEYPHDILPLYAQGHSVARFLLYHGGKRRFVKYIGRGMQSNNWDGATHEFYGYRDLSALQLDWLDWVRKGSPRFGNEGGNEGGSEGATPAGSRPLLAANISSPRGTAGSPLTITTPLPPLLRPTDREIESARNSATRDRFQAGLNRMASRKDDRPERLVANQGLESKGSWYATPLRERSAVGTSAQASSNTSDADGLFAPIPLPGPMPPSRPTQVRPDMNATTVPPRSLLPPANYERVPQIATQTSAPRWRHYERKVVVPKVMPEKPDQPARAPIHFDAPITPRLLR